jgi:hypothetical protein
MNDKQKSFEEIWVSAEEISKKIFKDTPEKEILNQLSEVVNDFKEIYNLNYGKEILLSLKKKKFGEILFLLTYFSDAENINIYPLLQENKILNEIRDIKITNQKTTTDT